MTNSIKLYFGTELGKVASITIPRAKNKSDLTDEAVKTAMDRIIATQIVKVIAGTLTKREKAEHITVDVQPHSVE